MTGTRGGPIVTSGEEWMRRMEKRVGREERRRTVTEASDLMGPGIGPFAVQILDWSAEETGFNGHFYSAPGALNSPDSGLWWIGDVLATPDGHGIQKVWNFHGGPLPPAAYIRTFNSPSEGLRLFTAWTVM